MLTWPWVSRDRAEHIERIYGEWIAQLVSDARRREEVIFGLQADLLTLKREGFHPVESSPEPESTRPDYPEGWAEVVASIIDRASGRPKLERQMKADALGWLRAGVEPKVVIGRIYHGWQPGLDE